jgi:O-antigen ligase
MARKKKSPPRTEAVRPTPTAPMPAHSAMPEAGGGVVVAILAAMMFLAPAAGVPHEEMLQDTLKSIIVSLMTLGAALLFFGSQIGRRHPGLRWNVVLWLPLLLMAYALGSMAWSHTYLAGVEAIRWFIFALLAFIALNSLSRDRLPSLAWGIHLGALVASLWAVLQFLADFRFFPQGPPPASTFVNRNFFAEFAVCTLPFAALLLARARRSSMVALLAASSGLVVVAILMTGTRAALIALWLQLLVLLPYVAWLYRRQLALSGWPRSTMAVALVVFIAVVAGLGAIPTGNAKIVEEGRGNTALERGFKRTGSISPNDASLGIRMIMWKATAHMISERPLSGVGAGAWENDITLYQAEGSQLETDYYVHNEFLQLLAEYGIAGWLFLLALAAWLLDAFRRTLAVRHPEALEEGPWRAVLLSSLLSLFIVSNVGFAWRMASTGALFALCLGALAASDARLGALGRWSGARLAWRPAFSQVAMVATLAAIALAVYITQLAAESEQKIVKATKLALTVSASGQPNHPRWNKTKQDILTLIREGTAINPHYRKITPMVADEMARWGDWKNATWIWESVLSSRPHVVAILSNVARGHVSMGDHAKAMEYLARAKAIQPNASSVRSLEVVLLARQGQDARALQLGRQAVADNIYDHDLANATFVLAWQAHDFELAAKAMELRVTAWPATRVQGYMQLGTMYADDAKDPQKAVAAFRQALAFAPEADRPRLLAQLPPALRERVAQMSASKG